MPTASDTRVTLVLREQRNSQSLKLVTHAKRSSAIFACTENLILHRGEECICSMGRLGESCGPLRSRAVEDDYDVAASLLKFLRDLQSVVDATEPLV